MLEFVKKLWSKVTGRKNKPPTTSASRQSMFWTGVGQADISAMTAAPDAGGDGGSMLECVQDAGTRASRLLE
ncbi:hypothetical protein LTR85_008098 [Meristemomyces frigidus]|nr:hypothetical protein LTR85_008098 [Meristemomyces frigidus]